MRKFTIEFECPEVTALIILEYIKSLQVMKGKVVELRESVNENDKRRKE